MKKDPSSRPERSKSPSRVAAEVTRLKTQSTNKTLSEPPHVGCYDSERARGQGIAEFTSVIVRWALGAFFVYVGLVKALDPVGFLKLVRQYDLTQNPWLLNSIAGALPWFEVFCGVLLLAGIAVRGSALLLILMLVPFTIAVWQHALAVQATLDIPFCAVKFDCGCGTGEVFICRKLLENFILTGLSAWLLFGRGRKFCASYSMT